MKRAEKAERGSGLLTLLGKPLMGWFVMKMHGVRKSQKHIDVEEIASGEMTAVPIARRRTVPKVKSRLAKRSGTLVLWKRCDLLDNRLAVSTSNGATSALPMMPMIPHMVSI